MAKQKIREKDKQQSTKHFRETTDWAMQTQPKKNGIEHVLLSLKSIVMRWLRFSRFSQCYAADTTVGISKCRCTRTHCLDYESQSSFLPSNTACLVEKQQTSRLLFVTKTNFNIGNYLYTAETVISGCITIMQLFF